MVWFQQEIQLPAFPQGIHKITERVVAALPDLDQRTPDEILGYDAHGLPS